MRKSKAVKIIERIAVQEGVSTAEVRRGLQEAIDIGYESEDESSREFWRQWRRKPTVEQFIVAVNKKTLSEIKFRGL